MIQKMQPNFQLVLIRSESEYLDLFLCLRLCLPTNDTESMSMIRSNCSENNIYSSCYGWIGLLWTCRSCQIARMKNMFKKYSENMLNNESFDRVYFFKKINKINKFMRFQSTFLINSFLNISDLIL